MRIDREGDNLLLHTTFSTHFAGISSNGDQPVLSRDGMVTLRVNLAAAPEHVPVMMPATGNSAEQQCDVLIPQFTVENADVNYYLGGNQAV